MKIAIKEFLQYHHSDKVTLSGQKTEMIRSFNSITWL